MRFARLYFLPFFFFLPPPPPTGCCGCACEAAAESPFPASVAVGASGIASSAGGSGTPAMPLLSLPRLEWMSRETSAALLVRYLRTTPLAGSYVLNTREPRGGLASSSGLASLRGRRAGLMEYLVVMRAYECISRWNNDFCGRFVRSTVWLQAGAWTAQAILRR